MFSAKFITELMKPQEIYSSSSTQEIFDRLAHSSIMRLSESSMDKVGGDLLFFFHFVLVSSGARVALFSIIFFNFFSFMI